MPRLRFERLRSHPVLHAHESRRVAAHDREQLARSADRDVRRRRTPRASATSPAKLAARGRTLKTRCIGT